MTDKPSERDWPVTCAADVEPCPESGDTPLNPQPDYEHLPTECNGCRVIVECGECGTWAIVPMHGSKPVCANCGSNDRRYCRITWEALKKEDTIQMPLTTIEYLLARLNRARGGGE